MGIGISVLAAASLLGVIGYFLVLYERRRRIGILIGISPFSLPLDCEWDENMRIICMKVVKEKLEEVWRRFEETRESINQYEPRTGKNPEEIAEELRRLQENQNAHCRLRACSREIWKLTSLLRSVGFKSETEEYRKRLLRTQTPMLTPQPATNGSAR